MFTPFQWSTYINWQLYITNVKYTGMFWNSNALQAAFDIVYDLRLHNPIFLIPGINSKGGSMLSIIYSEDIMILWFFYESQLRTLSL